MQVGKQYQRMKNKESIAITREGKDYMRIKPFNTKENKTELKFSFLTPSFKIRKYAENKGDGLLAYEPVDSGIAEHEITYHNSNNLNPIPSLLPKHKSHSIQRVPIFQEIIELNLKNILVPIPICRITVNQDSERIYKKKEKHQIINLDSKYSTTEIYVSSVNYDYEAMDKRFPLIVGNLFSLTTMDFLIYGAGMASEPMIQKMLENKEPVISIKSNIIGDTRFYFRTYEVQKTDKFRLTSDKRYSTENIIEFFNNLNYLALLATTTVGFHIPGTNKIKSKPAYKWDLEHLEKIKFHKNYIKLWRRRFELNEYKLKALNKFRSGIIYE